MNHADICKFIDNYGKKKSRKYLVLISVIAIALCFTVSGSLLQYFASVSVTVDVEPVILVDGASGTTIQDSFSCYPGNTTNITHTIENKHTELTYVISFNTIADEGLTVTFWEDLTEVTNVSIPSLTTTEVNFSYYVEPNVNPDEDLTATITVEYENAM